MQIITNHSNRQPLLQVVKRKQLKTPQHLPIDELLVRGALSDSYLKSQGFVYITQSNLSQQTFSTDIKDQACRTGQVKLDVKQSTAPRYMIL